ncbi:MAG: proline--tRNA ligase [Bacillota bacterium]|jgi:prolyl-tRNA synthetase|nr:proline--tRNA ligase [Bacillota bacterium]HHT91623.1 proline--tRNA ligase [Bacillota bacterium]
MLMSQLYSPTLRETPSEAEIISHKLMLRAGLMRRSAAGMYAFLPLGLRVIRKVEQIIREEMNAIEGQEVLLPIVQPAELWEESGRWGDYGDEMFRLKDRQGRQFCLGPTHEEIITALVRSEVRSYRQLPLRLYQIQNKYRDEMRPRFGLMRGREFIMKDMYSFDRDDEALDQSYWAAYHAYERIFQRCGVEAHPVEADSGAIGGDVTHEFMVLADSGEDLVLFCPSCGYAANAERAEGVPPAKVGGAPAMKALTKVHTPQASTIEQISAFLGVNPEDCIKTLLYLADGKPVAALIRGDHNLNEIKLRKTLECETLELADDDTILATTGAPVGFAGPVGLSIPLYADYAIQNMADAVVGANEGDHHLIHANLDRDFAVTLFADLRETEPGDPCPRCVGTLEGARGIEVGQVFKLGTKYSRAMGATFLDESGAEKPVIMGCYGIGVGRTVAAVIEKNHDQDGIIWPLAIAPYQVIIVPVSMKDEAQAQAARKLYQELKAAGVEVVLDDRDERPGVKFKDADLIGFPLRVTIGSRSLEQGEMEIVLRRTKEKRNVPISQVLPDIETILKDGESSWV